MKNLYHILNRKSNHVSLLFPNIEYIVHILHPTKVQQGVGGHT